MTRREFSFAVAGLVSASRLPGAQDGTQDRVVVLEAVAGFRLPHRLMIRGLRREDARGKLFERRTYTSVTAAFPTRIEAVFARFGIRPLWRDAAGRDVTYWIPFDDLAARERAWTALNADPNWIGARSEFQSYRFGLYRAV